MLKLHTVLFSLERTDVQEKTIKRVKLNYLGHISTSPKLLQITRRRVRHGRNKGWYPQMLKLNTMLFSLESMDIQEETIKRVKLNYLGHILTSFQLTRLLDRR